MDLDLLDLDMFARGEQDELFPRLRREAPVSWQDHPQGRGFWSVVQHGDVVTVNRDAALFSSEVGSISLLDPGRARQRRRRRHPRRHDDLLGPAPAHPLPPPRQ